MSHLANYYAETSRPLDRLAQLALSDREAAAELFSRLYAAILTSMIAEGAREVAAARTRRQATAIIDAVIEYARRLMTDGPWKPPARTASRRDGR